MFLDWPGLGHVPARPGVDGLADLARMVLDRADDGPVDQVPQSMGGVIARMAVLARPALARRIVLTATSAGIPIEPFFLEDWRPDDAAEHPRAASWIREERPDLSAGLPGVTAPTLCVWSDSDPISPVGVGRRLAELLPHAELVVVPGVDHMFARDHAELVAPHVLRHLGAA